MTTQRESSDATRDDAAHDALDERLLALLALLAALR